MEFKKGGTSKHCIAIDKVNNNDEKEICNDEWPKGVICIIGDSMISQLTEHGLSGSSRNVKVRCHPGCTTEDLQYLLMPVIMKKPTHIIIHVGTNNTPFKTSREIFNDILFCKFLIEQKLPTCSISISSIIRRNDGKPKASVTISKLNQHLKEHNIMVIDNDNINRKHLGKKGLHLNEWGTRVLAMNYIDHMKHL